MSYAAAASRMDAAVDSRLGDLIHYSVKGAAPVEIRGFALQDDEGGEFADAPIDPLGTRRRLKIAKNIIARPHRTDRIECAELGEGIWQPSNKKPRTAGRYWLFDVQRV